MNNINYTNTGHLPSKKDYRLLGLSTVSPFTGSLLPSMLLDPDSIGGVQMQALQPACVVFSVCYAAKAYFLELTGKMIDFEPAFLYSLYLKKYNFPVGNGCNMNDILKLFMEIGCATKATINRSTNLPLADYCNVSNIPQQSYIEALNYKIPGFLAVNTDIQSIRQAMNIYKIVMTCRRVGTEWYIPSWSSNDIEPLRIPNPITSGHGTCDIGYTLGDDFNIILNQWSTAWANNGKIIYKGTDLSPFITEAYVISKVPSNYLNLVKSLPSQDSFKHNFTQTLKLGDSSDEVQALQIALMIDGCLSLDPSIKLGYFGNITQQAVNKFQLKYASKILTPLKLSSPTGTVGNATNKQLNFLFNGSIINTSGVKAPNLLVKIINFFQ